MKRFNKYTKIVNIREFIGDFYQHIDCSPIGQRIDVDHYSSKPKAKKVGIIKSILQGIDIGKITIHKLSDVDGRHRGFTFESIDGGHRKRYIYSFVTNEFCLEDGRFFRDLTEEEREFFLNYELTFCIYTDLSPEEIGEIFRTLNETTPVNHQEKLNSYGDIPIANAVRETVRYIPGIDNDYHRLFNYNNSPKRGIVFDSLKFDNNRLKIEEMVSRIYYRYYAGGGLGTATDEQLEQMFKDNPSQKTVDTLKKKVDRVLSFIYSMGHYRKTFTSASIKLDVNHFVMYYRLWMWLEETYGDFTMKDDSKASLYRELEKHFHEIVTVPYEQQIPELQKPSPWDASKTYGKDLRAAFGNYKDSRVIKASLAWITDKIDFLKFIVVKDPNRLFTKEERERKLIEQDYKCFISGEEINLETSQGAHIDAHSEGNPTVYENLVMVKSEFNKTMGSMSVTDFKKIYDAKVA